MKLTKHIKQMSFALIAYLLMALSPAYAIEHLTPIDAEHWLLSTADGLYTSKNGTNNTLQHQGQYEYSAIASLEHGKALIAAINKSTNALDIFVWQNERLNLLSSQIAPGHALVAVCLSSTNTNRIEAFVIKEDAPVEHRIVFDSQNEKVLNVPIRDIMIGTNIADCKIDAKRETVYLLEEQVGIWRVPAHAETDAMKSPVDMIAPFGDITDAIESISLLSDGVLVAVMPESGQLMIYPPSQPPKKITISDMAEVVSLRRDLQSNVTLMSGETINELSSRSLQIKRVTPSSVAPFTSVTADAETNPVERFGDAADDPAIWYNAASPEQSLILGTDKKQGLGVYDLQGNLRQFLNVGRINNVDLRDNFVYQEEYYALASASQRDRNTISLFLISSQGEVHTAGEVTTTLDEVYGLCMSYDKESNNHFVFINDKDGRYQQYHLKSNLKASLVREFRLPGQPEGCIVDDTTGELFMGVEDAGIWLANSNFKLNNDIEKIISIGGALQDDVEGLALYFGSEERYLVVSSQGNDSYALYKSVPPFEYIASFTIDANLSTGIDGASETDGLEVSSHQFGNTYPQGMLVVQDGRNVMPAEPQNFKIVSFEKIVEKFALSAANTQ